SAFVADGGLHDPCPRAGWDDGVRGSVEWTGGGHQPIPLLEQPRRGSEGADRGSRQGRLRERDGAASGCSRPRPARRRSRADRCRRHARRPDPRAVRRHALRLPHAWRGDLRCHGRVVELPDDRPVRFGHLEGGQLGKRDPARLEAVLPFPGRLLLSVLDYTSPVNRKELLDYARRPWAEAASAKSSHWVREFRAGGPEVTLRAAQSLWLHMARVRDDWP